MSIFSSILDKIMPGRAAHPSSQTPVPDPASTTAATTAPATTSAGASTATTAPVPPAATAMQEVDVEKVLNDRAATSAQQLNWRTSIVDLMKLLDLDSSFNARKSLATELHYSGDSNDSAAMNIWLHKQVMAKLAQNGGKVPKDLMD